MFAQNPDPWGFRTSDYEKAKYADTIAALDNRIFQQRPGSRLRQR